MSIHIINPYVNRSPEKRYSGITPEDIDLSAGQHAIQTMLQRTMSVGAPLTYGEFTSAHVDLTFDVTEAYRKKLPEKDREKFDYGKFEQSLQSRALGRAAHLNMLPSEEPMFGSIHAVGELGIKSEDRPSRLHTGLLLGTIALRNDGEWDAGPDEAEMTFLDFDLHSSGTIILNGEIDAKPSNTQTHIWQELHLDQLTPLEPDRRNSIAIEPLGNRQIQALTDFILDRLPR